LLRYERRAKVPCEDLKEEVKLTEVDGLERERRQDGGV
jgi:hypothetical protein